MIQFLHIKKSVSFLGLLLIMVVGNAQENTIHTAEWFKVSAGTKLYVIGDFTDSTVTGTLGKPISNLGDVYFKKNLINKGVNNVFGAINQSAGNAIFNPASGNVSISGDTTIHFHNLEINLNTNTNYLDLQRYSIVNDSLLMSLGDILLTDSINLYYSSGVSSPTMSGIINETDDNRLYGGNLIRVENYPWNSAGTYTYGKLKGVGLDYTVSDYLGASTPIIRRYNAIQSCGPSQNSVNRTYGFSEITTPGLITNISAKFHDTTELGLNVDGTLMHIYKSHNLADSWEDINGTPGSGEVTISSVSHNISDNSVYTIAKDTCDVLPNIQMNQIITTTTPLDTLFDVSSAMACDPVNLDATIMSQGDPGIYTWLYPDNTLHAGTQDGTITPSSLGEYVVIIQDIRGCINMDTITIGQAPAADASFTTLPAGYCQSVGIPFLPIAAENVSYTYLWEFGDGSTSSLYNPTHTYSSDSIYSITLTVTTDQGCIDGNTETLVIHPIPTAAFSVASVCPGDIATFDNNSLANPTQPVTLSWDFLNDGSIDTTSNGMGDGTNGDVFTSFPAEGTYSITLTASSNGCVSTPVTQSIAIFPMPAPSFTYQDACEGQSVIFDNLTTISDASTLTYLWNFNSFVGPTSILFEPTNPYANSGTYSVTLEATSVNGCVADTVIDVDVDENPTANFNVTDVCVNNAAIFPDVSTVGSPSTINSWSWDFGDTNTSISQNGTNIYTADGNYTVQLTVSTVQGCTGVSTQAITIFTGPTIGFSALDGCINSPIAFQNTTTNATSYNWTFPFTIGNSASTHQNETFTTDGTQVISLYASSSNGCSSTYTDSIVVFPLPVVNLGGPSIATCGTSYILDANLSNVNAGSSYFWTTGATTSQFTATYNGSFGVTVTSAQGCIDSDNATITLNTAVVPNLGVDRIICDNEILDAGYSGATYAWLPFGQFAQSINVTSTGTYSVSITDQNGCIGSGSVVITVTTSDPVSLGANTQIACAGDNIILDATSFPTTNYVWQDGSTSPTFTGTTDGYYSVELTNSAGCISGDTVQLTFNSAPSVSLGLDAPFCEQTALNVFTPNADYLWNTGSTQSNELITLSGTYWVDVTDPSTNCTTRDSIDIIINALPIVDLGNDTALCSYNNITLDAQNSGSVYVWNNGESTQTTTVYATGNYSVDVTDVNGCSSTGQVNVIFNSIFEFDLGPDLPFCTGSTITLDPDAGTDAETFNWYSGTGQLSTQTTFSIPDTGIYYVEIVDTYGCVALDSITILPSNLSLSAIYLSDSEVIVGDTIQFINLSFPSPYDSFWDFDNGASSTDSMPTYNYFVPGDYDVTLTVDNGNCVSNMSKTITVSPSKILENQPAIFNNLFSSILELVVYPNPNDGQFNLKIRLENESAVEIDIFNLIGQRITSEKFIAKETVRVYDLKHIRAGMYIVRVRNGKETKTIKFIKL